MAVSVYDILSVFFCVPRESIVCVYRCVVLGVKSKDFVCLFVICRIFRIGFASKWPACKNVFGLSCRQCFCIIMHVCACVCVCVCVYAQKGDTHIISW